MANRFDIYSYLAITLFSFSNISKSFCRYRQIVRDRPYHQIFSNVAYSLVISPIELTIYLNGLKILLTDSDVPKWRTTRMAQSEHNVSPFATVEGVTN